jgi:hypothetical protein
MRLQRESPNAGNGLSVIETDTSFISRHIPDNPSLHAGRSLSRRQSDDKGKGGLDSVLFNVCLRESKKKGRREYVSR